MKLTGKCVAVFCGSSEGASPAYKDGTIELGHKLADGGHRVICGGASVGLMGVLAESVAEKGGDIVGVLPRFLTRTEPPSPFLTRTILVETMAQRKDVMLEMADDIIIMPGGFGSLDEAFEAVTMKQLGKRDGRNIFVSIDGFWKPLQDFILHLEREGFVILGGRDALRFVQTVNETLMLVTHEGHVT